MPMSPTRDAYLLAAGSAARLLADPAVSATWPKPSALTGFTVGGLAEHLATQVIFVPEALARPEPGGGPVSLADHYGRVTWLGASLDEEANVTIRRGGETAATEGPDALVARIRAAVAELRAQLPTQPAERLVHPPGGPWGLRLDDFLVTRMMEIAVHSDDLAVSAGVATPELPPQVLDPVLALLSGLAVRRHGQPAVLRTLSRAERAPGTISAF
jgi:uncharacterized protein (TIGR03083 family)